MKAVSVRELSQGGASKAVRAAESEPVLVSRHNEPAVIIVSLKDVARVAGQLSGDPDLYAAVLRLMAVDLFDHGVLSMGRAAQFASLTMGDFIDLCDQLQVSILREPDEGLKEEVDAFSAWLQTAKV